MEALNIILKTRWVMFVRRMKAEQERGALRAFGIVCAGLGILAIVFSSGFAGAYYLRIQDTLELMRPMMGSVFLTILMGLLLSCLGHTANSFFTAQDLWLWNSTPVPPVMRFFDRMVGAAAASIPATLGIGGVAVFGLLLGAGEGVLTLCRGVFVLCLLPILPLSAGVLFSHLGGVLLPAGRIRRISIFLVGLVTCLLLIWVRSARLERYLTEEGAAQFLTSVKGIENVGPFWLPTNLGAAFVMQSDWEAFSFMLSQAGLILVIAFLVHRLSFNRARDLADDESPKGLARHSLRERAIAAYARLAGPNAEYIARKDLLAFVRDPSQWSQLMLLVGIAVLYLINCQALLTGFERFTGIRNVVLPSVHVGIVCFISAGLAARFAFVQVSLEGAAVWLMESAPISPRKILMTKILVAYPLVGFFPLAIGLIGSFVFEFSMFTIVVTFVYIFIFGLAFTIIGVSKGAVTPLFDAVSVSEMAMAPGALSTMVLCIVLCGAGSLSLLLGAGFSYYSSAGLGVIAIVLCALPSFTFLLFFSYRSFLRGEDAFYERRKSGYTLRIVSKDEKELRQGYD